MIFIAANGNYLRANQNDMRKFCPTNFNMIDPILPNWSPATDVFFLSMLRNKALCCLKSRLLIWKAERQPEPIQSLGHLSTQQHPTNRNVEKCLERAFFEFEDSHFRSRFFLVFVFCLCFKSVWVKYFCFSCRSLSLSLNNQHPSHSMHKKCKSSHFFLERDCLFEHEKIVGN